GNAPATASLGRCNHAHVPRPHRTAPDRPTRAPRGPGRQRRNTFGSEGRVTPPLWSSECVSVCGPSRRLYRLPQSTSQSRSAEVVLHPNISLEGRRNVAFLDLLNWGLYSSIDDADRCPLSPHKRRKSGPFLTAASCHNRTHAAQQIFLYSITSVAGRLCQATDRSALIVHKGQRQYRD